MYYFFDSEQTCGFPSSLKRKIRPIKRGNLLLEMYDFCFNQKSTCLKLAC